MSDIVTIIAESIFVCLWLYAFYLLRTSACAVQEITADLRQIEIDISHIKNLLDRTKR